MLGVNIHNKKLIIHLFQNEKNVLQNKYLMMDFANAILTVLHTSLFLSEIFFRHKIDYYVNKALCTYLHFQAHQIVYFVNKLL